MSLWPGIDAHLERKEQVASHFHSQDGAIVTSHRWDDYDRYIWGKMVASSSPFSVGFKPLLFFIEVSGFR